MQKLAPNGWAGAPAAQDPSLWDTPFSPGFLLFFFVGFVQFPIYGLIMFLPQSRSARIAAAFAVFVVHAIAVIVVFANEIP